MDQVWSAPAWAVLAALVLVVLLLLVGMVARRRDRARIDAALDASRAEAEALRAHIEAIAKRLAVPTAPVDAVDAVDTAEYKITMLGDEPDVPGDGADGVAPVVPAPLFADLVLRESVVQAASFAAGLRRALAPETRNRIRFEMRREVKRARKQRRADARLARQEYEARQRAGSAA